MIKSLQVSIVALLLSIGFNHLSAQTDSGNQIFTIPSGTLAAPPVLEIDLLNDITINAGNDIVSIEVIDMDDSGEMMMDLMGFPVPMPLTCGDMFAFDAFIDGTLDGDGVCGTDIIGTDLTNASTFKVEAVDGLGGLGGMLPAEVIVNLSVTLKITWKTCAADAGENTTISICRNNPIDLMDYLDGTPQTDGTWYDMSGNTIASSNITTPNIQGQYQYSYKVSVDVDCQAEAILTLDVLECDYLSVETNELQNVNFYPNPIKNTFTVTGIESGDFQIEILSLEGKTIYKKSLNNLEKIDASHFPSGIYLGVISNKNLQKTVKLVVE